MNNISKPPRKNSKVIAVYNIRETNLVMNLPFSFSVSNRYNKIIVGAWSPIKLNFDLDDLKYCHVNEFKEDNEKHFIFSDGLFMFWFITDNSNKLIRVCGTQKWDYDNWDVPTESFTPELVRAHNNNIKVLNTKIYLEYGQEIINKTLAY